MESFWIYAKSGELFRLRFVPELKWLLLFFGMSLRLHELLLLSKFPGHGGIQAFWFSRKLRLELYSCDAEVIEVIEPCAKACLGKYYRHVRVYGSAILASARYRRLVDVRVLSSTALPELRVSRVRGCFAYFTRGV